jgi:dephospho-CoA kinase
MAARPPTGRPYVIGLTGSIAMGKSGTAKLFAAEGVKVHDADAVIHTLYGKGGAAVPVIAKAFPQAVKDGAVDRGALSAAVAGNPAALAKLEQLVHPLVAAERQAFLAQAAQDDIVVLDIPLLLEIGLEGEIDALVVASAPASVQRERVLSRPGMTEEKFQALLARQLPDVDKRAKAHFVVVTDKGVDHAQEQVRMILATIREKIQKP